MSLRLVLFFSLMLTADVAVARVADGDPRVIQSVPLPAPADSTKAPPAEMVRRRVEVLVRSGRAQEAIEMLEARRDEMGLDTNLERRLARLYRDVQRWQDLETLLLGSDGERSRESDLDIGQLRLLAEARFELGEDGAAQRTLDAILDRDRGDASLVRLVSNVLAQRDRPEQAIRVLVESRERLRSPLEFAQMLGRLYAQVGQLSDAAREYARVVVSSPLNISLMRGQMVELAERDFESVPAMRKAVESVAGEYPQVAQLGILVSELQMIEGDDLEAWRTIRNLLGDPALQNELLRLSQAGLADSRLPNADPERTLPRLRLSSRVARGLLGDPQLPRALEPRVYDALVRSLLAMLENQAFQRLPDDERTALLDETRRSILAMQERFSGNSLTGAAILRLAGVYVDGLHRPEQAIELYERLTVNPNSSREHVKLARIGLGRSYIAAGDTSSARDVFYAVGQDMEYVEGQGRAQYHLGMIDFMGGHFETAADRFEAVAMEQPRADYTNDALDLAVALAEFAMSGDEDDTALRAYGEALYLDATHQSELLLAKLTAIASGAPGELRERSRVDLAHLDRAGGRERAAIGWLQQIAMDSPQSRYAASALDLEGEILEDVGDPESAMEVYDRILTDYSSYVMIDRIRDRVRLLRQAAEEDELP